MLDSNALSQLQSLKKSIADSKDRAEGIVKGTQRRFGFVVLDDGREVFLSQSEMEKVFNDDRIKVEVVNDDKGKPTAVIEKLVRSDIREFCGTYHVKGKGHFVQPDVTRFNRWIFVPPQARNGAKNGDFVRARITRHAFPHGKPQASILKVIGDNAQAGIEADYMIDKFGLDRDWPKDWQTQLLDDTDTGREDLRHLPLVTIDAASSRDLDDALCAEANESGWQLTVAVADPTALIKAGSALENEACRRATSVYLPGVTLPMLPAELSAERCSLLADQERPALACRMQIDYDGRIADYQFCLATVRSQAKLSYQEVSDALAGGEHALISQLQTLQAVSNALLGLRQRDHLVIDGRPEYRLILGNNRKIESIEALVKTPAHTLVEECMVAANRCAALLLGNQGLFNCHGGFRPERLPDVHKLAEEQLGMNNVSPDTLEGYRSVMQAAATQTTKIPLHSILARLLERGRLSNRVAPHFGMSLPAYSTFTSPLRRFSDFIVHRLIKQTLANQTLTTPSDKLLAPLQERLDNARQARQQMEQWLKCEYLQPQLDSVASGVVSQVNSNGFTVRLDGTGVEGFIEARGLSEKVSFDPMRMRLHSKTGVLIELDQPVKVKITIADALTRTIRFELEGQQNEEENTTAEAVVDR